MSSYLYIIFFSLTSVSVWLQRVFFSVALISSLTTPDLMKAKRRYFTIESGNIRQESPSKKPDVSSSTTENSLFIQDGDDEPTSVTQVSTADTPITAPDPISEEPESSSGYELFKSQLLSIVGDATDRALLHLYKKYFNQPNYIQHATNEYFNGMDFTETEGTTDIEALRRLDVQVVDDLYQRMKQIHDEDRTIREASLWTKFIGNLTVEAMATRPTMRPL